METEFYDQRKWLKIHRNADDLIAKKDGTVLAALYRSPDERTREDQTAFVRMLQEWACDLSPDVAASTLSSEEEKESAF